MKTIRDELKKHGYKPSKKKRKRSNEKLSEYDLKDLMGVNRPRYFRGQGGSYRQR